MSKVDELRFERMMNRYKGTDDELKAEIVYWKHKYQSQCSKMGAYKAKVAEEIREREFDLKRKEQELRRQKLDVENKEEFLKNTDFETLKEERNKNRDDRLKVEEMDKENRDQLYDDFANMKQEIIDELSKELIRWTEENDIDNQRSQGYVIGINKAKKIIKEKMIFKLKNKPLRQPSIIVDVF